jgi:hypothetical protein
LAAFLAVFLKFPKLVEGKKLVFLAFIGETLTVFGLWFSSVASETISEIISAGCVSLGLTLLILAWSKPFTKIKLRGRVVGTASSAIIGCLTYFLIVALPETVSFFAGTALSVVSMLLYFLFWMKDETVSLDTTTNLNNVFSSKDLKGFPFEPRIIFAAIVYACLFTLIGHAVPELENEWLKTKLPGILNVGVFFVTQIIIAFYMAKVLRKENPNVAYRPVILLMASALALLPFVSGIEILIITPLSLAGFGCAIIYFWISMGNACQRYALWSSQVFILGILYLLIGMLLGELLVGAILLLGYTGTAYSAAITSIGLFALVVLHVTPSESYI